MKTKSLLLLATAATLFASIGSAQSNEEIAPLVLPKFVVTAPRHSEAEKKVSATLDALRAQASADAVIASELPFIKGPALSPSTVARATQDLRKLRVAKS